MCKENRKIYNYIVNNTLQIEKIMDDYTNYIFTIVKNMSSNISSEDIEEVILDVYLVLWQNQNRLDINKDMSSYIAGVTRNLVKLKFRKLKFNENIEDYENTYMAYDDLELDILNNEKRNIIRLELEKIKNIDRDIFIEYYYKEKNIKEICSLFKMSETKIKSKLFRVRKKIKKALKERGYDLSE